MKWIKRLICKFIGHKWTIYPVSISRFSSDIEQAGYCDRCGFDTHEDVVQ